MSPDDRKYTKTHEWVKIEGQTVIVGITDHAQAQLGDITFLELPARDKVLEQGVECGVVESVKAASDIYAPVSGKVVESNNALNDDPGVLNKDPYGRGWLIKLTGVAAGELAGLLDAAAYDEVAKANE